MSKAFVKDLDSEADLPYEPPAIPAGIKNYMTSQGHCQMQDELHQLLRVERPKVVDTVAWVAGNGDRSESGDYIYGKRRLREIDRRIRFLSTRLASAEVVDPKQQKKLDQVFFGERKDHHDRRDRRGRSQSRSGELGIAGRQSANEGARGRHRRRSCAVRNRADRSARNPLRRRPRRNRIDPQ
jgi:transcription elongation factor-like protein